jgi:transcription elongation factor Elf1
LEYLGKTVRGIPGFLPCIGSGCKNGFLDRGGAAFTASCESCGLNQKVERRALSSDEEKELKALVDSGVLRPCPRCGMLSGKDYGMCNVMHCGGCGVYWNWRSRDIGESYNQMKNRARTDGTMWEPGELDYQRRLERQNPKEFQRLLERNGIHYDPNYIRGT